MTRDRRIDPEFIDLLDLYVEASDHWISVVTMSDSVEAANRAADVVDDRRAAIWDYVQRKIEEKEKR